MAGKRYQAKDRKVAKMERTGLVEENIRTGEKTRTSKRSLTTSPNTPWNSLSEIKGEKEDEEQMGINFPNAFMV